MAAGLAHQHQSHSPQYAGHAGCRHHAQLHPTLGVRCHTCHEGEEGTPLEKTDFASDKKRMKLVARQMMRMVEEINHRLDTIPERPDSAVQVACRTCHRGVSRPAPLYQVLAEAASAGGADSSIRAYQALRQKYYGRDAYDFGE